ncbi:hypothetical protein [Erysipelothrix piscisicarius]
MDWAYLFIRGIDTNVQETILIGAIPSALSRNSYGSTLQLSSNKIYA